MQRRINVVGSDSRLSAFWAGLLTLMLILISNEAICQGPFSDLGQFTRLGGLSQNSTNVILQDFEGYLWVGTQNGLNRYDGYQVITYHNDPGDSTSITNSTISSLYETQNGELWIGTQTGELNQYDRINDQFINYEVIKAPRSFSNDYKVHQITEDKTGNLWMCVHPGGLFKRESLKNGTYTFSNSPYNEWVKSHSAVEQTFIKGIYDLPNGHILFSTSQGLLIADPGIPDKSGMPELVTWIPQEGVHMIYIDSRNLVWVVTHQEDANLKRYDPWQQVLVPAFPPFDDIINTIMESPTGKLWFGLGTNNGLAKITVKPDLHLEAIFAPKDNMSIPINSLLKDRGGVFWVGSSGEGLYKCVRLSDRFINYPGSLIKGEAISKRSVQSIFENVDGHLWLGGYVGAIEIDRKTNSYATYSKGISGFPHPALVSVIYEDPEGKGNVLWLGIERSGLFKIDKNKRKIIPYRDQERLKRTFITDIKKDKKGSLWVGTTQGLFRLKDSALKFESFFYSSEDSLSISHNHISSILEDEAGNLWIGTEGGGINLLVDNSGQFTRYLPDREANSIRPPLKIKTLFQSQKGPGAGQLWVGSGGGGLVKMKMEPGSDPTSPPLIEFEHFTVKDGLPNNTVYGILEDGQSNLWLSTNYGLSRFSPETKFAMNFHTENGLPCEEFNANAVFQSKSGEMFFGGVNGLTSFFPNEITPNSFKPKVRLSGFKKFNQEVILDTAIQQKKHLIISHKDKVISFEFSAVDYANPSQNQYAYYLEGFAEEWTNLGKKRDITFTNLKSGKYILYAKASNSDGIWGEPSMILRITVKTPFWATWWFYFLAAFSVVMVTAVIARYFIQISLIKQQRIELRRQVEARTGEVLEKKEQITLQAQKLRQANEEIRNINTSLEEKVKEQISHIRESEKLLSLIYNSVGEALMLVEGPKFKIITINRSLLEAYYVLHNVKVEREMVYGMELETMLEKILGFEELEKEIRMKWFRETFKQKKTNIIDSDLIFRSGEKGSYQFHFIPILNDAGECTHLLYSARDTTQIKLAGERIISAVIETEDKERKRIAKELHDSLGQNLTSAVLNLKGIKKNIDTLEDYVLQKFDAGLQSLDVAIEETRNIAYNLMPKAIDDFGYVLAVESMLSRVGRATNTHFEFRDNLNQTRLDRRIEISLYRITQEAVNNIMKHAQANRVSIQLNKYSEEVVLTIEDDGIGFDKTQLDTTSKTIGLGSMATRVQSFSGTFTLETHPGRGTLILVQIPVINS